MPETPARTFVRAARLAATAFGTTLVAVLLALAPTGRAVAEPSVEELEAQIDQAWETLEPIIEQYNEVHGQLKDNQAKVATLQKQLEPLELQISLALSRVSELAVHEYKFGAASVFSAMMVNGSPTALVDQLVVLNQFARSQQDDISLVAETRDKFAADKKALDELVAKLQTQDADLAAKKKEIEGQIKNLQKLRQQAYGSSTDTGVLRPAECPYEYVGGAPGIAAKTACQQIGDPYVFAAEGPNAFDCSGLTQYAWKAAGVGLPHNAKAQYNTMTHISKAELRPGDLIFFYNDLHHVGIYVGGNYMVHASRAGEPVKMVKAERPGTYTVYGRPG